MAMNNREKLLTAGVGVVIMLFVGRSVVGNIQNGFTQKKQKVDTLTKTKNDQALQVTAGLIAGQKLNLVSSRSLSKSEEKARADYMQWLISLGEEAKLEEPIPRYSGEIKDKEKAFHLYKYQLSGSGTIENAIQLLYGFYSKDYLHKITRFDVRPSTNGKEPNRLTITLDCEVLALGNAKEKQDSPSNKSIRVTKSLEDYKSTILERNIFAPLNIPPELDAKTVVDAKIGLKLEHSIEAKESDPTQFVIYEVVGDAPKGLLVDKSSGKLSWSSNELGEFKVDVKATDSGIPARSTVQSLTINVKELPPAAKEPVKYDIASQAMVTALITGSKGPEAWVLSKTESKTFYLRKGDDLKLGGVQGKVLEVGANYVEIETEGRKWLVGLDESLADAFSRGQTD